MDPLALDPLTRILPQLAGSGEICRNGIDDDSNGLIDCADRAGCADGTVGPAQEILATQCCGGRAVPIAEFHTVKNCGACGNSCIYPDESKNEKLYHVGTCENQRGTWSCVHPEDAPSRQKQLMNSACYSGGMDPLSKALETIEKLEPKIKVGDRGALSISVSRHCAQIHFRKHF